MSLVNGKLLDATGLTYFWSKLKTFITGKADAVANSGSKNLLEIDALGNNVAASSNVFTSNGITFTLNKDSTVTASGTATANAIAYFIVRDETVKIDQFCDGNYILSGCPSGGSTTKYRIYTNKTGYQISDTGSGATLTSRGSVSSIQLCIWIASGQTVSNLVFKPMIRHKDVTSSEFVPYGMKTQYDIKYAVYGTPFYKVYGSSSAHTDADNLTEPGIYRIPDSTAASYNDNTPPIKAGYLLVVRRINATNVIRQEIYVSTQPQVWYVRHKNGSSAWTDWWAMPFASHAIDVERGATSSDPVDFNSMLLPGKYSYKGIYLPYISNRPKASAYTSSDIVLEVDAIAGTPNISTLSQTVYYGQSPVMFKRWGRMSTAGDSSTLTWTHWYEFTGTDTGA